MVHHRQRLAFGFKASDNLASIHSWLKNLQSDLTPHGLGLLGHEDDAEAPFADLLQELVGADDCAGTLGDGFSDGCGWRETKVAEETAGIFAGPEQRFNVGAHARIAAACLFQIR